MVKGIFYGWKNSIKYATCHAVQLFNVIICYKKYLIQIQMLHIHTYIYITKLQKARWARGNVTSMTASQQ